MESIIYNIFLKQNRDGTLISVIKDEVTAHISKESASAIPITSEKVEVVFPALFKRWGLHPHLT